MDYAEFSRRVAEGPPPIGLFVGDERFLHREALSVILKALGDPPVVRLSGGEATPAQVTDECYGVGLFSARQVVVIDEADQFVSRWPDVPKTWLDDPPASAHLLLWAPKPKPRRKGDQSAESVAPATGSKRQGGDAGMEPVAEATATADRTEPERVKIVDLFPAKPTKGCWVVRCEPPVEKERPAWMAGWATELVKRAGKTLAPGAAAALVTACGDSLDLLSGAIAKCASHAGSRKAIETADVRTLVSDAPDPEVFALTNAIAGGRTKEAFLLLRRLLDAQQNVQALLGLLNWQAWQVYRIRRALDAGVSADRVGPAIGAKWVHPSSIAQARQATAGQWRNVIGVLAESDRALKTSSLDPALILELGILRGLRPALAVEAPAW